MFGKVPVNKEGKAAGVCGRSRLVGYIPNDNLLFLSLHIYVFMTSMEFQKLMKNHVLLHIHE